METGRETFNRRLFRNSCCWYQDDIDAACLGLAKEAKACVSSRAKGVDKHCRFPAFWGPGNDYTPDEDHGGVLLEALQMMLLQADDGKIHLLPAWPKAWDVKFKLHAPGDTVVSGELVDGKIVGLDVSPAVRRSDLIVHEAQ